MDTEVQGAMASPENRIERCDLCGSVSAVPVLRSADLDGPLVRCSDCGLHFVTDRGSALAFGVDSPESTAQRLQAANDRFVDLPRSEERRLNELNAEWRLDLIRKLCPSGRLLEVGCGRGDFLRLGRRHFEVAGIEPSPELADEAGREGRVHRGLVADAPMNGDWTGFDVVVSFHVIEHVSSPMAFVRDLASRLKPGGLLVLETPDIGSMPFRIWGARWRQFIPEHYYFFDRMTLGRLIEGNGFRITQMSHIGKHASIGLILNRLGRQIPFMRRAGALDLPGTIRINPRDILLAMAVRKS
jgi:2-polyprenyl-3-methyl-5-hydroxy-6-metoxy-1,4-benzoquinol methylase